ncbi:hypothetical protein H4R33_004753 [Dimargaris cristalligena]|uniref:Uncharacterized protein n=1 Tax=Dimargaris cristalligena TaxID=215637 RepID=A0A4P9ZZK0_9FUNG|nr:hypothetical protein H4R33_004753 [Dimargaris cristalligena]RKP39173.1 hypothetical protein BJ085DRAFT_31406 [Dimargaris cristalligena]|eukprot:RKP39173.1 hypothetical protein BJ085DRAFT_31406 [Dimargaris cristalligena]
MVQVPLLAFVWLGLHAVYASGNPTTITGAMNSLSLDSSALGETASDGPGYKKVAPETWHDIIDRVPRKTIGQLARVDKHLQSVVNSSFRAQYLKTASEISNNIGAKVSRRRLSKDSVDDAILTTVYDALGPQARAYFTETVYQKLCADGVRNSIPGANGMANISNLPPVILAQQMLDQEHEHLKYLDFGSLNTVEQIQIFPILAPVVDRNQGLLVWLLNTLHDPRLLLALKGHVLESIGGTGLIAELMAGFSVIIPHGYRSQLINQIWLPWLVLAMVQMKRIAELKELIDLRGQYSPWMLPTGQLLILLYTLELQQELPAGLTPQIFQTENARKGTIPHQIQCAKDYGFQKAATVLENIEVAEPTAEPNAPVRCGFSLFDQRFVRIDAQSRLIIKVYAPIVDAKLEHGIVYLPESDFQAITSTSTS